MSIQEQGRLRATLQRKYQMSPGGVERWAKERERKRKLRDAKNLKGGSK